MIFTLRPKWSKKEKKSDNTFQAHEVSKDKLQSEKNTLSNLGKQQRKLTKQCDEIHSKLSMSIFALNKIALILGLTERRPYLEELVAQERENREINYDLRVD